MKKKDEPRIKYRVAGIAFSDQRVLIYKNERSPYWSLPGGRVEFMESSSAALKREVYEETGLEIETGRMVWVIENFFKKMGTPVHELGLYYLMNVFDPPETDFYGTERTSRLIFRWQDLKLLDGIVLYPEFLKKALFSIPDELTHSIEQDFRFREVSE